MIRAPGMIDSIICVPCTSAGTTAKKIANPRLRIITSPASELSSERVRRRGPAMLT